MVKKGGRNGRWSQRLSKDVACTGVCRELDLEWEWKHFLNSHNGNWYIIYH